jgi:hypothetical protein
MNKRTYLKPELAAYQFELTKFLCTSATVDAFGGLSEGGSGGGSGSASSALGRRSNYYGDED